MPTSRAAKVPLTQVPRGAKGKEQPELELWHLGSVTLLTGVDANAATAVVCPSAEAPKGVKAGHSSISAKGGLRRKNAAKALRTIAPTRASPFSQKPSCNAGDGGSFFTLHRKSATLWILQSQLQSQSSAGTQLLSGCGKSCCHQLRDALRRLGPWPTPPGCWAGRGPAAGQLPTAMPSAYPISPCLS